MIIEMFPAKSGDAFLIRFNNKKNILVDMGYSDTYKYYIKDRLASISKEKQCIDLLVITHIDEDHIEGAIEFFKENGDANNPNIIEVKEVWHNSYRHLQFDKQKKKSISYIEKRQLEDIKISNSRILKNEENESYPISARQGSTLAGYLYEFGYVNNKWNKSFNFEAINLDYKNEFQLGDIKVYMLSPDTNKLKNLSNLWVQKLNTIDKDFSLSDEEIFDDAYEFYIKKIRDNIDVDECSDISYGEREFNTLIQSEIKQNTIDRSKSNGASISFIIEYNNKKILFLGDAHEDIIVKNIEKYKNNDNKLEFDVVKVSHHGSIKNNFEWIDKIKVKKYLFSTNGEKHNHPNDSVIAKILKCNNLKKELYFNYPIEICNTIDNDILKEKYNYSIVKGNEYSSMRIEVIDNE